jgi:hypothetical protein
VSVTRAGGGGGATYTEGSYSGSTGGTGGAGGGGAGGDGGDGVSATINTGSGGGGAERTGTFTSGSGGSGIVILKVPDIYTATFSGGVTSSLDTSVADYKIYSVTATSTTGETVTFS